jgi:hypothetical protein
MGFSTSECSWSNTSVKVLGRTVTGIRGFSFKKGVEKEHLYAAGADPVDIQSGNKKPEGSLKLLKYELDLLNDAAQQAGFEDITDVPHDAITVTCLFKKNPNDVTRVVEAQGVAFSEVDIAMEQNAKMTEVSMPFLAMKVISRKGQ